MRRFLLGSYPAPLNTALGLLTHRQHAMSEFHLNFDLQAFHELDEFSLLARQDYNYGNKNDWFGAFRGGL